MLSPVEFIKHAQTLKGLQLALAIMQLHRLDAKTLKETRSEGGITYLIEACRKNSAALVSLCLSVPQMDINSTDDRGNTALHWACRVNNLVIVTELLERFDCMVNIRNKDGLTPFMLAVRNNSVEMVKLMINYPWVDFDCAFKGQTALFVAMRRIEYEKEKINRGDVGDIGVLENMLLGDDPLEPYALEAHKAMTIFKALLETHADPNFKLGNGENFLTFAVKKELKAVFEALCKDPRVDVNVKDKDGVSAIKLAFKDDFPEHYVNLLLERKELRVNGDPDDISPVSIAILNVQDADDAEKDNCVEALKRLLERPDLNFNVMIPEVSTLSLIDYIIENEEAADTMVKNPGFDLSKLTFEQFRDLLFIDDNVAKALLTRASFFRQGHPYFAPILKRASEMHVSWLHLVGHREQNPFSAYRAVQAPGKGSTRFVPGGLFSRKQ